MKRRQLLTGFLAMLPWSFSLQAGDDRRQEVRDMAAESLERFYAADPGLRANVSESPGYAVFSNVGVSILFFGGAGGYGLARSREGEETFMRMGEASLGLGLGAKDYRVLFIFRSRAALRRFVGDGWDFGAHGDAAVKSGEKGGASSDVTTFNRNVEVYQLTETGLMAQVQLRGTKYWKAEDFQ